MNGIDRCACGCIQGYWSERPLHPGNFGGKNFWGAHSPIGCFRTGGLYQQCYDLYHQMTGLWLTGVDYPALFQAVITKLKENPELASTLPVVLTPTPLIPIRPYESPRHTQGSNRGRVVGGGPGITAPAKPIPVWEAGKIKPPWIK